MANPASVNCGNIGGTTEIKKNADGSEYGMCTFANGTSCEEWALFRGEGCKAYTDLTASSTGTAIANPASVNCGNVGGTTEKLRKMQTVVNTGCVTFETVPPARNGHSSAVRVVTLAQCQQNNSLFYFIILQFQHGTRGRQESC